MDELVRIIAAPLIGLVLALLLDDRSPLRK
jgi:hypothetical protein